MKHSLLLIVVSVVFVLGTNRTETKEFLDFNDPDDNNFIIKHLFVKINTILERLDEEGTKTKRLQEDLRQSNMRLEALTKQQEKHFSNLQNREWKTILRRQDGSVDFNRNWTEYKFGFGNRNGELFIGLEELHVLTTYGPPQELLVMLRSFENETRYAKYDRFRVGNETEKYAIIELGTYSGDAGNSLEQHKGMKFSTPDQDNDIYDSLNCAKDWASGWWFRKCYFCNLAGVYRSKSKSRGVDWTDWKRDNFSLMFAEMRLRSKISLINS
ncbi:ficolin-2-like [Stomoxys calcitrans]|uniref:Fibrinogen C-terminal domain-containing protein n=1 Tax=Stomoxys calcitrans TaxID=35570 RepID=A0A1I8PMM8_STOCA|nr:ficolin-2-like [Stomoxys calcitrans]